VREKRGKWKSFYLQTSGQKDGVHLVHIFSPFTRGQLSYQGGGRRNSSVGWVRKNSTVKKRILKRIQKKWAKYRKERTRGGVKHTGMRKTPHYGIGHLICRCNDWESKPCIEAPDARRVKRMTSAGFLVRGTCPRLSAAHRVAEEMKERSKAGHKQGSKEEKNRVRWLNWGREGSMFEGRRIPK